MERTAAVGVVSTAEQVPPRVAPIQRRVLAGDAYEVLKGMILDQAVAPGARVSIDLLAVELGVSQTPIREALARLEGDGLVTKRAHGRYWTTPMLTTESFEQLYDIRLRLEPFAAGEAGKRIARRELDALGAALASMETAKTGGDYSEYGCFSGHDARFHETIGTASGNPFLADAIARLHSHLQLARLYRNRGVVDAVDAVADHCDILAALERHDWRAAAHCMKRHIERSRGRLGRLIAGLEEPMQYARVSADGSTATAR
jgi:DNA-binding GntR family transcriptional regulator